MKKYQLNLFTVCIMAGCYSANAFADLQHQCLAGIPQFYGELTHTDSTQLPVYIEADNAEIHQKHDAIYSGDVIVKQGDREIRTAHIQVTQAHQKVDRIHIQSNFAYQDHLIQATGKEAIVHLQYKSAQLKGVNYQLVGRQGRGYALSATADPEKRIMKNASFTSCLPNNNAWIVEANEMVQHVKQEYAELWHARFKVMGMPIFYSPYLQFPIGDRRRSGILVPDIGHSSRDGYFYSQPFYWNIAPNFDATFTPTYYSRRGWQLSPELRYLTKLGEGKIAMEFIQKDKLSDYLGNLRNRYLLFWQHNTNFDHHWHLSVDYTQVSDRNYFSDFNSNYGNSTDGHATQRVLLGYFQPNYNVSILAKRFQTFDNSGSSPYQVLPQINFHYYKNALLDRINFLFFSQISHFANPDRKMPSAWRFHVEPAFTMPLINRFGSLNLETKLYATQYWQRKGRATNAESIQPHVSRLLPQIKLDFKTTLEASHSLFSDTTQTLEPRVQYLYRPYRNQQAIGSKENRSLGLGYDSALLQQTYFTLFNDRRYSGLDRIASANQITLGGTARYASKRTGEEIFNFSAGQIYYLSPSRIDTNSRNSTANRSSSWSLESYGKFHSNWNWHVSYQYDTRLNKTALAQVSLQFKPKKDHFLQLNYHYANKNYIDQNLSTNLYGQDIKQLGGIIAWKLTKNIAMTLSHYQDIALKKPVETRINLAYDSCCWGANIYVARHLTSTPSGKPDTLYDLYYDNHIGVNVELRFGQRHNKSSIPKMSQKGLIPYTETF